MGINIRTNIPSLAGQRNVNTTTHTLKQSYMRLSTGLRISTAADDAAGLAIANQLRADQKIGAMGVRNANDGISVINIADSTMDEMSNMLTRMAELAQQSANGVYSTAQRSALEDEFVALGSELERVANTTKFNGQQILMGGMSLTFQVGFDGGLDSRISYTGTDATLSAIGLASAGSSALNVSINGTDNIDAQANARVALDQVKSAIGVMSTNRGKLGAAQNRLEYAISNLEVAKENFAAAESRIRDIDVAFEAAELTRLTILQQAGVSVLSQANQQPGLALKLLG